MATFQNQATLTYNGGTANSNIVTGEIVEVLSAAKTALGGTYSVGETVTYVISIVNTGAIPYTGLVVTDDLGAYAVGEATAVPLSYVAGSLLYYADGVLQPTPTVEAGPPLTVAGISVPANGNAVLVYEAAGTQAAPPVAGGTVTNRVEITGGGLSSPVTAEETVTADESAALVITKSLSPTTVVENGQITYTFVISNTGNTAAVATDDLVLTDTFDPVLSDITVTLNGAVLTEGADYNYDGTTGLFTTVPGRITVPAASYAQDPVSGEWTVTPGTAELRVVGTV